MQIEFLEARDGSKTFSANGVFYHSSYSPSKEAQRFIEGSTFLYNPKLIFFIEPGLNYFSSILKQKFPECKIICIRLFEENLPDENTWDSIIKYDNSQKLSQYLITNFGEDALLCSTILIWKPAEQFFKEKIQSIIIQYKTALENCKTLLVTRQFFEKKWLINCCNFIKNIKNIVSLEIHTALPVVVCASGPSLNPCIQTLKTKQNNIFIICLSSALSVLIKNNITPDLILSTDGGYWAGEHLKYLKKNPGIILAAPCDAFVPKKILHKNPVLPLRYNDESSFICNDIITKTSLPAFEALRNPTVSGTGLYFAKSITNNKIYFCGLDLSGAPGYQHSQPNEIEKNNELSDSRIKTKETRIARSRYNTASLQIYRDWFSSLDDVQNVLRVINKNEQESLGKIKDISPEEFDSNIPNTNISKKNHFSTSDFKINNIQNLYQYIKEQLQSEKWSRQIFPADYISIQNCSDQKDKEIIQQRLNEKIEKLILKIRRICDE